MIVYVREEHEETTPHHYQRYDASDTKHTVLTVEFADAPSAKAFAGGGFVHEDVKFKVIALDEWLERVGAIKDVGKKFAAVFGPWPFMPTFDTITQYKGLLTSTYGDILNVTIYKDRTVTIGFGLGARDVPKKRKALAIMRNGNFMGTLHPIRNIRMLGLGNCLTCCGIGEFHGPECEDNKTNFARHVAKKKKLHAQNGARSRGDKEDGEWEQVKSARRGVRGNGKANMKANREPVAKQSWADMVGA